MDHKAKKFPINCLLIPQPPPFAPVVTSYHLISYSPSGLNLPMGPGGPGGPGGPAGPWGQWLPVSVKVLDSSGSPGIGKTVCHSVLSWGSGAAGYHLLPLPCWP